MFARTLLLAGIGLFSASLEIVAKPVSVADIEKQTEKALNQELTTFIKAYPGTRYQLSIRPVSTKKDLNCASAVVIKKTASSRAPTGIVKRLAECPDQWRLMITADVDIFVAAVHSVRSLSRGETITADSLHIKDVLFNRVRGRYFVSTGELIGRQLKRSVSASKLLTMDMLSPDYLVRKGDSVMITAGSAGLEVTMAGIALENGSHRETIKVRNRSSGKVIDARIVAEGRVKTLF